MMHSRINRLEERKQQKRLLLALGGILAILFLVGFFGLKALIGFSLFVDNIRGKSPTNTSKNDNVILPPTLDAPAIATNSATIPITGKGQKGLTAILFVNGEEYNKLTVEDDGTFSIKSVPLKKGDNTISAKLTDTKGNTSDLSNVVSVTYGDEPPKLVISAPSDNATVNGEPNTVEVNGITDDETTVTINDRLVVVRNDNSFTYNYPLNEGDNVLKIVATDTAGNQTTVEKKVTYHK